MLPPQAGLMDIVNTHTQATSRHLQHMYNSSRTRRNRTAANNLKELWQQQEKGNCLTRFLAQGRLKDFTIPRLLEASPW